MAEFGLPTGLPHHDPGIVLIPKARWSLGISPVAASQIGLETQRA